MPELFDRLNQNLQEFALFQSAKRIFDKAGTMLGGALDGEKLNDEINLLAQEIAENQDRFAYHDQWKRLIHNEQMHGESVFGEKEQSEEIAHKTYCIDDYAIFSLREERKDASGQPYVICLDEKTDGEVATESTSDERREAVNVAINRMLESSHYRPYYVFNEQSSSKISAIDNFYVAAVAYAIIFAGISQQETHKQIVDALSRHRELKFQVTPQHQKMILSVLRKYQSFISTTQLEAKKDFRDLTEVMTNEGLRFELNGETYEAPSDHGPFLDQQSLGMIAPMQLANQQSREAMIQAAKQFAREHLGVDDELLSRVSPPGWFTNGCSNDSGIVSREILMYITDNRKPIAVSGADLNSVLNQEQPKIISFMEELLSEEYARRGWCLVRLSDSTRPCITAVSHLTS